MKKFFGLVAAVFMVFMISGCDMILGSIGNEIGNQLSKGAETPSVELDCESEFSIHYGDKAELKVNASVTDGGTLSYQWYKADDYYTQEKNRTAVSGATDTTLTVSGNSESDTYYWCKVSNAKNLKTADSWSSAVRVIISNIVEPDDITSATTWNADYTYYIDFDLSVEATLVIPAGTVIKFNKDAYMGTRGNGVINAVGTEEKPIIFTAANDNSVGIAIPKDKTNLKNTTPKAGEWESVRVDYQGSKFDYCIFQYGGSEYYGTLILNAKTTVTNCTFKDNASDGSWGYDCPALNIYDTAIKSTVTGNTFYNNDWPLACPARFTVDTSNVFHKDDLKNTRQLICLNGDVEVPVVWGVTEVPYCFVEENDDVVVKKALTIEDDVVVKFGANASLDIYTEDGGSLTVGDAILTSMQDDEHGGDTNCDGDATTPDESDWEGVWYSELGFDNEINKSEKVLYRRPIEE